MVIYQFVILVKKDNKKIGTKVPLKIPQRNYVGKVALSNCLGYIHLTKIIAQG